MRHYEIMVILDPSLEERTVAPSLDTYLNVIRTSGGSVEKLDVWGRRRLSYEINKKAEGIYAVIDLQATPAGRGRAGPSAAAQRVRAAHQGHPAGGPLTHGSPGTPGPASRVLSYRCGKPGAENTTSARGDDHGRRNHHHGHRQPDRRPRAALHPVGCGGGQVPRRVDARGTWTGQSGEWKDGEPLFLSCTVWRQAAENVAESLQRGARVIVSGRLRQRSYETREGEKRTVIELEVDEIGPSLRYATAKVQKMSRARGGGGFGLRWRPAAAVAAARRPVGQRDDPAAPRTRPAVGRATSTTSPRSNERPVGWSTRSKSMAKAAALRKPKKKVNPLDKEGITYIDYKDTALLRKFISDRGKIRARRVTGVTSQQQRQIARAVKNAREMALLPYTTTAR